MERLEQTNQPTILQNKAIIWGLILTITLIWGYAWVLMKQSLNYMGPFTFSSFRFGTGALTLLIVVWIIRLGLPPKRYIKHLILIGLLQTTIVFTLVMFALMFVDAGKSSVLLYSMPLWSSLLAVKFLGEHLTRWKIAGLLSGMIGLLTILGWDIWLGQSLEVIVGEILIIISAVSWAVANIYYRLNVSHLPKIQSSAFQMLFGVLGIFIATLIMESGQPIDVNSVSLYYILFTGVLASALCFTVWYIIMNTVDMVTATISTLLVPMFGLILSSLLLNEQLTIGVTTGSALILLGIVLSQITFKSS
ncbi:DMT family transporter [Alkalibacillus salilacus]|uniref:Drug/metabolite transporter (DMT)-like permease n=1 Tax=Alkalibacillus salilacus TaxID=284582 RepID=A0ABT9VFZ1_9BACI|nr:DMT family transporter [Alkalibacillus salilacus]MDQ0159858.1 drug/metabolite transporter (DMT)-like permease [Alkalibacillus salilacus]